MPCLRNGDINLYYEVCGRGPAVVLSHGVLDDCSFWEGQAEALSASHTVITYDHRGHGRSDKPRGEYTVQALADDLHRLIKGLNIDCASLVGYSLGGMTALRMALDHPERVHKLVLVCTAARVFPQSPVLGSILDCLSALVPYDFVVSRLVRSRLGRETGSSVNVPKYVARAFARSMLTSYDLRPLVHLIRAPTLIISGEKDPGIPLKMSLFLHAAIKDSRLEVIPECGHLLPVEKPVEFSGILSAFLAR